MGESWSKPEYGRAQLDDQKYRARHRGRADPQPNHNGGGRLRPAAPDQHVGFRELVPGRAPKGIVYNYPMRPWHDAYENITAYPAQPDVAAQVYARPIHPTMLAKVHSGQSNKEVIAWTKNEREGFLR